MPMTKVIPLFLFIAIVLVLWRGLTLHPQEIPSPLIDKPAPAFQLPELNGKTVIDQKQFQHQVTLLNVWATWCAVCAEEHDFLVSLATKEHIHIIGLNYKDNLDNAKKWLAAYGNPYQAIAIDATGETAINWGVYGAPETFIIDKKGIIRYKHIGALTPDVWQQTLKPIVEKFENES